MKSVTIASLLLTALLPITFAQLGQGQPVDGKAQTPHPNAPGQAAPAPVSGTSSPAPNGSSDVKTLYTEKPQNGSAGQQANDIQTLMQKRGQATDSLVGIETTLPPELSSFLASPPAKPEDLLLYDSTFDKIVGMLRQRDPSKAVVSLYEMGAFPWDAGISEQLGNRVLALWDMQKNQGMLTSANKALLSQIKQSARNADVQSDAVRQQDMNFQRQQARFSKQAQPKGQKDPETGKASGGSGAFLPNPAQAGAVVLGRVGAGHQPRSKGSW
jgi:hypothetical protein